MINTAEKKEDDDDLDDNARLHFWSLHFCIVIIIMMMTRATMTKCSPVQLIDQQCDKDKRGYIEPANLDYTGGGNFMK